MNLSNFLHEFFIKPIIENEGYNPVNTIVYGVILIIAIYLLNSFFYWMSKKYKVKIEFDANFMLGITPFIFFGSILRVLEDAKILPFSFWFITPGIYILTFLPVIITILVGLFLEKKEKIKLHKFILVVGIFFLLPLLPYIKIVNSIAFLYFFSFLFAFLLTFRFLANSTNLLKFLQDKMNFIPFAAHIADATATFVSLDFFPTYGYIEQHVVPNFFISLFFGSASVMYLLKIFIVLPIIYLIQKHSEDKQLSDFLRVCIYILGMAPAVRDIIRIAMLV